MKILHVCPTFDSKTCGIGAYTRHLCAGIKAVDPSIEQSILNSFASIYEALLSQKPDACHIQFEYSFCSPQRLLIIDSYCNVLKIPLFITFHTLAQCPHNNAVPHAIKLAHTGLSKDYGNFTLIPSGIPRNPGCAVEQLSSKLLAKEIEFLQDRVPQPYLFFGQAHPHKQLLETLEEFKENWMDKRLVCVVSKPVQGDLSYYAQCYDLAQTLPNVCWIQNYLEDAHILCLSYFCNTALFPYIEYGSIGISAAVKLLLNNLDLKIYTTYASHFSDIPEELSIVNKYHTLQDMLCIELEHDKGMRQKWIEETCFEAVAVKHIGLYKERKIV